MGVDVKYSPRFFWNDMPDWKKKKDPFICRLVYRPISFVVSSFVAEWGISANTVSYISAMEAVIACLFFCIDFKLSRLMGAILVNVWLVLDCVDGNLARSVKREKYGDFADATSSYILVGILCTSMGISAYYTGGIVIPKHSIFIVLIGAFASSSDSLMRLVYQKYKNVSLSNTEEFEDINPEEGKGSGLMKRIKHIEETIGIGGILPLLILIATVFNALDIVVIYCFIIYGGMFIVSTLRLIKKTYKLNCI